MDVEGVACADESGCVVHTATAGEGGVLVGTDGALGVVKVGSAQQHIAPFQTQPGDQGLAVVDTPGLQVQGLGAAHEARAVVDGAAACLDVGVAQGLDLSTCAVVKAGAGEVHGGLAHDLPRCVVDLPRGGAQLPLCAQEARSVGKCAGAQGEGAAVGHGVERVEHQVDEHLGELGAVRLDGRQVRGKVGDHADGAFGKPASMAASATETCFKGLPK